MIFALATAGGVRAQDAATQQEIDKLTGQLQDITDAEAAQSKRIEAIEHDVADLRDKLNAPPANNYASADDLQKLASQLQDIDKKRRDDRELILNKIDELAKLAATAGAAPVHPRHPVESPENGGDGDTSSGPPQKGHYYVVQPGNSLSAIVKAYQDKGVKVTLREVEKANPDVDPKKLLVGQKVFIPDPAAK